MLVRIFVFGYLLFTDFSVGNEIDTKRLVLHSDGDVAATVQLLSTQIAELTANLSKTSQRLAATEQKLTETAQKLAAQGSTFIRWGRTACRNGTEFVYKGYTAGSTYNETGNAADYICLTKEPIWGYYDNVRHYGAVIFGTEYEMHNRRTDGALPFFGRDTTDHDSPCAVCRSSLPTTIMIPGRNICFPGWTLQYSGYLVSGHRLHQAASNYACLDTRPEVEEGDARNEDGKLMYMVEAVCGSLKCPPYVEGREISCAVCSK